MAARTYDRCRGCGARVKITTICWREHNRCRYCVPGAKQRGKKVTWQGWKPTPLEDPGYEGRVLRYQERAAQGLPLFTDRGGNQCGLRMIFRPVPSAVAHDGWVNTTLARGKQPLLCLSAARFTQPLWRGQAG